MAEKMNGLSLDFIIHPGETLKEVLEEKQMSQEELAIRTGFSPKHVSEVVNGKKGISPSFARSLEYVFGIPTSFWINLQGIYDKEMLEYKEQEEIDENEVEIVKKLKKVIEYAEEQNVMNKTKDVFARIIELRNICNVKNLTYINNLVTSQVAFRKSQTLETNVYVLYVWLRICDIIAEKNTINEEYDEQKLMNNIEKIKDCMFLEINEAIKKLKELFAECGVVFQVVKNFAGAPVQGFIRKNDNKIILSMTIRRAFADEFWFTLFHEIGHLLNGDIAGNQFIDYADSKSNMEEKADEFASNALINEEEYRKFVESGNLTEEKIRKFSKEQNVKPFIVVGRIQREQKDYKLFYNLKTRYIIHTVAPKWYDFRINNKEQLLKSCYINSYELAKENKIKTIAFPCLGMGVYQVPLPIGAKISIDTAIQYANDFEEIYLVCFKEEKYKYYCEYLNEKQRK